MTHRVRRVLATDDGSGMLMLRLAAGGIFVSFSFGKFLRHSAEVGAFERYDIPLPELTVYLVGTLELGGGIALILGLGVRPVALALAANMAGAIASAGRIDGGAVHLGLAPALLIAMLVPLWRVAGARSLDRVIVRGAPTT